MSLCGNSSAKDKDLPNLTQVMHCYIAIVILSVQSNSWEGFCALADAE